MINIKYYKIKQILPCSGHISGEFRSKFSSLYKNLFVSYHMKVDKYTSVSLGFYCKGKIKIKPVAMMGNEVAAPIRLSILIKCFKQYIFKNK